MIPSLLPANILIVDDIPDNLRLLAKILESQHYTVRKSLSGKMALKAVHRDPPDLILLDINMPEMSGYEVCQQLKTTASTLHIPIIFISALGEIDDKIRAFEFGAQDYITKPFQELEVLARIKNQLIIQQQRKRLEQEVYERQTVEAEVRRLNTDLEQQVQARTLELQQSLKFETTLKRITDKVRDSLDQHQVLQNAVEELAIALEVERCDAVLFNSEHQSSLIRYQYVAKELDGKQRQLLCMVDVPELYHQLAYQQVCVAFCPVEPCQVHCPSAILACPVFDDQVGRIGILGGLWLFKNPASRFTSLEIHLVQQVASQCAIALRQARLYAATQSQVQELQRLNQLKDDFLSTISHELRTPIASMKMILKLLSSLTEQDHNLMAEMMQPATANSKVAQYFQILQEECDRELALVEDLLSLQHIEAGTYASELVPVNLQDLILHLTEPFESRTQNHHQTLQIVIDQNLTSLRLDVRSISRVVTELLTNASKYTPSEGVISIKAAMIKDLTKSKLGECLQLSVTNTGVEIDAQELSRVFDKFYRIPNHDPWKHGGTGLGLALVKKLVEQMGGSIVIESANNQTCFKIRLWEVV